MIRSAKIWAADSIAAAVRRGLDGMTPSERKVAHVLLSNYPFAGLDTVNQFALRAGVSPPSILRFVSRLGFLAYPEFQRRLKAELAAQLESPLVKTPPKLESGSRFTDIGGAMTANIAHTFEGLIPAEVDATLKLLGNPKRRIHLAGGRLTEAIALYALRHLRVIRGDVGLVEPHEEMWRDVVIDFDRRDVLVVFDIRRYQKDVLALAEETARRRTTIVLMTDQWLSPVSRVADHVIAVHTTVPSNWDSHVALLAVVEALLASLTKSAWKTAEPRMKAIERLREA
ncbi:MAG: MurR/RpiR family transcriptional regulator [Pseudorhodoplanes sp.]|uniref:MurR/RpiR family transcriptional regulator n=1 Tax=Pseudorhodoplanes sp. TaxID=1934341 RepID=UPI003D0F109F